MPPTSARTLLAPDAWRSTTAGDLALATLVTALVVGEAVAVDGAPGAVALAAVMGACLAVRRRHALASYVVSCAALLALPAFYYAAGLYAVPNLIGLYSVGAHAHRRASVAGLVVGLTAMIGYWAIAPSADIPWLPGLLVAAWALAWVAGQGERQRRRAAADALRSAQEAQRRRDAEQAAALADERARIAREVHDVVGHALNVMVLHAGAARRQRDRDPAASATALGTVEDVGRRALHDLDHALDLLGGPAPRLPGPGAADLGTLVEEFDRAGVPVRLEVHGEPRDVPATVGLALYRTAQEALTNVTKHAPGHGARVHLHYLPGTVTVHVVDTGPGAAAPGRGAGRGLAGLDARARSLGGRVVAGPRTDAGWEVRCELPTTR